ncbi:MAG: DUF2924 domain-containing protein [Rhodospirillales bacterium]
MATQASAARSQPSVDKAFPIDQLNSMAAPEMVKLWEQSFGDPPLCKSRPHLLRLLLAARLQDANNGDRDGRVRRRLVTLAAKFAQDPDHEPSANLGLRPGIELVRAWKGVAYRVHVMADGFVWNGRKHASLSVIAREITGTAWSGPAFFKLKRTASA